MYLYVFIIIEYFFRRSVDYSPPSFLSFFAHLPNHLRFIHALYPKCIQNTKYILYAIQFVLRRILNPTCPASNRLPNNPKGGSNLFRLEDFFKSITSYFWLYSSTLQFRISGYTRLFISNGKSTLPPLIRDYPLISFELWVSHLKKVLN